MKNANSDSYRSGRWRRHLIPVLAWLGVVAGVVVLFQVINLPVEFNASTRAKAILVYTGMITTAEEQVVSKVLTAAAMTYVAATIVAAAQLVYFAMRVLGGRD